MKRIKESNTRKVGFFSKDIPDSSYRSLDSSSFWEYANGKKEESGCVNCLDIPCREYSEKEIDCGFNEMPSNNSKYVCASEAIKIAPDGHSPFIDEEKCISCGLCASRCKYSAIFFESNSFRIRKSESSNITYRSDYTESQYIAREEAFPYNKVKQVFQKLNRLMLESFHDKTSIHFKRNNGAENEFAKNMLLSIGIKTKSRAIGNNDIRTDLFGENDIFCVLCEVDTTSIDQLDLTRAILDDIAIFSSRYGVDKAKIIPLLIIDRFPNKRSDFYEVLNDIEKITKIKVGVISLHFIFVLSLLGFKLNPTDIISLFKVRKGCESIVDDALSVISELNQIDPFFDSDFYFATK
jgi:Fe-S-cluster-containing hydrogenase component 2